MSAVWPLGAQPVSESYPPNPASAAAYALMRAPVASVQFLIDIDAYRGGKPLSGGLATISEIPLASFPPDSGVATGSVMLRFADRDWVGAPVVAPLAINVPVIPAGIEGAAYAGFTVTAATGMSPYRYFVSSGTLPAGLTLDEATGEISGTPLAAGHYDFVLGVEDSPGGEGDSVAPNLFYDGRVSLPLMMDAAAPLYPENARRVLRQFGAVEIINSDGALDNIIQAHSVDGRSVRIRFGPYMADSKDFAVIADMVAVGWQPGDESVRLTLRDQSYNLDQPVQVNLYAGTGDEEGTAELEGKPKPLCYGDSPGVTPVLVDPPHLIYQIHDGQVFAIDAVYDRGGLLTLDTSVGTGGDAADTGALVSASVGASKFATCTARGTFKLGSSPAGVITADVRGDVKGGVYTDDLAAIALRIMYDRAGLSPLLVDEGTFIGTAAAGGPVGLYIDQNDVPSASAIIDRLIGSVAGWWGSGISGKLRASRLLLPETTEPVVFLDQYDIVSLTPEAKPVPRWRQRVGYAPNWTVQRGEDLDVTVSDARRQVLTEPYSVVIRSNATLQIRHLAAQDPAIVETLLRDSADAQALADYLQSLYGVERQIYRVVVKYQGLGIDLGACVNLSYPRFGLAAGQNFIVIARPFDGGRGTSELRVWG